MSTQSERPFAAKHTSHSAADLEKSLTAALAEAAPQGELSCAAAFRVAAELGKEPAEIGRAADLMELRLVKCQLGLFGYPPGKKIVQAAPSVTVELETAIQNRIADGQLACRAAWDLAEAFQIPRMAVSAACETLAVKIKPCQLGAF
jgi:hypothetical protein